VFVEVKSRKHKQLDELITYSKMKRISNAALQFLASHPHFGSYNIRFDYIFVKGNKVMQHIGNGWDWQEDVFGNNCYYA